MKRRLPCCRRKADDVKVASEQATVVKPEKPEMIKLSEILKYSSRNQKILVYFGVLFSVCSGAAAPWFSIIMGRCVAIYNPNSTALEMNDAIIEMVKMVAIVASILWACGYAQYAFMQHAAEKLAFELRQKYLSSLMRQETEFFELQQVEALPSKISEYFAAISSGLGEKFAQLIYSVAMILAGIGLAFWRGASLAGVTFAFLPLFVITLGIFGNKVKNAQGQKLKQMELLGGHTEETMSAMKLVISFAQEGTTLNIYNRIAAQTTKVAKKAAILQGVMGGIFLSLMFGFYLYGYGLGTVFIDKKYINPTTGKIYEVAEIIAVTTSTVYSVMVIGGILPLFPAIIRALVCMKKVFEVIERVPKIKDEPGCLDNIQLKNKIVFKNVQFRYPTQVAKTRDIFAAASFEIKAGQSTAIVGPSGSGKSTIVQLINRYYNLQSGEILFDELPLQKLSLKSLRSQIGYVSQEPVLILGTIRENLLYGNADATESDMWEALNQASAQFVKTMEQGLDSYVGSTAVLNMSGGQKQRIAIARALIKKPKILVLDEATSALDSKSEHEVQEAIDNISAQSKNNLTIIMIAHRLSTISSATNLLYLEDNSKVIAASKGTKEYEEVMERLMVNNYAHQKEQKTPELDNQLDSGKSTGQDILNDSAALLFSKKVLEKNEVAEKQNLVESTKTPTTVPSQKVVVPNAGWGRVMKYYNPKILVAVMVFTSIVNAFSFPILGAVSSKFQFIITTAPFDPNYKQNRDNWIGYWLAVILGIGIFSSIERATIGVAGENLILNVRKELISAILHKQLSWFDSESRAPGVITSVFSEDISTLNAMTSETIIVLAEAILGLCAGIGLALYFNWPIALLAMAASPLMIIGVIAMSRLQWGNKGGKNVDSLKKIDIYEKANALLSDVILNYKTVFSFGDQNTERIFEKFRILMETPLNKKINDCHMNGFAFGYSSAVRMIFTGIVFYLGTIVINKWHFKTEDVFLGINIMMSSVMGVGVAFSNVPSVQKAKSSAQKIFAIVDEKSTLDVREGLKASIQEVKAGEIKFLDVNFQYPSRNLQVLDNFNMVIPATFKIALVGASGCGKSTITNLLLRFYNIQSGKILIDGHDIASYNVQTLRRQIGFVMQEPILFNQSIKDNILFGQPSASNAEIRRACEQANALQFIESNFEELNKEQRTQFNHEALQQLIKDKLKNFSSFDQLKSFLEKEDYVELLIAVLSKSDEKALNFINQNIVKFVSFFTEIGNTKGLKWDDVVVKHEWNCEIQQLFIDLNIKGAKDQEINIIKSFVESKKYLFDTKTVNYWLSNSINAISQCTSESLRAMIEADSERIRMAQFKRFEELTDNLVALKQNEPLHTGFDKICGLKGSKLSGGQKQRIAIARALIKKPKILVLDEATSALDEASQEIVQQALDRAMEGRTSIVIAHRLSTIRNCQLLFVLDKGKIVEQGTYESLSADHSSYFYKLKSGMEM